MENNMYLLHCLEQPGDLAHRKLYPAIFRLFQKVIKNHLLLLGQHVESGLITILECRKTVCTIFSKE